MLVKNLFFHDSFPVPQKVARRRSPPRNLEQTLRAERRLSRTCLERFDATYRAFPAHISAKQGPPEAVHVDARRDLGEVEKKIVQQPHNTKKMPRRSPRRSRSSSPRKKRSAKKRDSSRRRSPPRRYRATANWRNWDHFADKGDPAWVWSNSQQTWLKGNVWYDTDKQDWKVEVKVNGKKAEKYPGPNYKHHVLPRSVNLLGTNEKPPTHIPETVEE
jgi:hypothetical protein